MDRSSRVAPHALALLLLAAGCAGGGGDAPAAPSRLLVASGASRASIGEPATPVPAVQLTDGAGASVARAGVQVTVALGELEAALSGTTAQATDASGLARFPDLRLVGAPGTYHLIFSTPGLSGARSTIELEAGAPAVLRAVTVQQQYAPEWSEVRAQPAVLVTDALNNPVPGAHVRFAIVSGGGSVLGDALTGPDGKAVASSWTLGPAGEHVLEARVDGLQGSVSFTATALPQLGMLRMTQQPPGSARLGDVLAPPPQVQLFDAWGSPSLVAGVPVTVGIGSGAGPVVGTVTEVTDCDGRATFPYLAFSGDVAGTRTLLFSSNLRAPAESAPVSVGMVGGTSAYGITLRYLTGATPAQAAAFEAARARISAMITGDVPDLYVAYSAMSDCGNTPISEPVDDLLIWVELVPIDGYGGILGQSGPCLIRSTSKLPVVGIMMFDTADLAWLESAGQLDLVILHEMLHVVGFGTIWRDLGVASGLGGYDPFFIGAGARAAYLGFDGGASYGGVPVPVENSGGAGTRDGHWRESVLGNELMTGWLGYGQQPLSRTTIASLGDLGYVVDLSRAESLFGYSALRSAIAGDAVDLGKDVLDVPLRELPDR
jgi:hypothetical protein